MTAHSFTINDQTQTKQEIKDRFDMLGYAQRKFQSVVPDSKGNYRIEGYQGLLIKPEEGVFYRHGAGQGGDILDFIGFCLFNDAWDKRDAGMFKSVLEEGAQEVGIYHANSRPGPGPGPGTGAKPVGAPYLQVVDPGLKWHYPVKGKKGEPATLTNIHRYPNGNEKGRFEFIDAKGKPDKVFAWRHPVSSPAGGQPRWTTGANGKLGLYNLEQALSYDLETPIIICESEKEVDLLAKLKIPAVCGAFGAGKDKWPAECNASLTGRKLILSPDRVDDDHPNDPGPAYFKEILDNVYPVAKTVKLLDIDAHDITRWLSSHTADELQAKIAGAPLASIEGLTGKQAGIKSLRAKPKTISAKELIAKEFAPLEYIVPGILPTGSSLLASKPKLGKSWMILNIAIAVAAGGVALSQTVKKGAALYLALEDNEPRLKRRLAKLCPDGVPDGLDFATDWKRSDQGGLEDLEEWLQDHPDTRFVAIDTLQKWRKPASGRDNIYNADYEALDGVTRLASKYGVSIVIAHHTRKGTSEDPLEEVSGSNGLTGAVDNALILSRSRGEADAVIYRIGRDLEEDAPLALSFDKRFAIWSVLGNAEEHALTLERQEIIKLLKDNENGLFPSEIAKQLGKNRVTVQSILTEMKEAGQVSQEAFKKPYKLGNLDNLGNYTNLGNLGNSEGNEEAPEPVLTDTTGIDEPPPLWSPVDISNTVGEVSVVAQVAQVADSLQENLTQSEAYTGYARLIETLEDYFVLKPLLEEIQRSHEITSEEKFNLCSAGSKRLEEIMF